MEEARTTVPDIIDFERDAEYMAAPELKAIAEQLIQECPQFAWLQEKGVKIAYLWKRDGGTARGKLRLAQVQKTSKLLKHFITEEYLIWVAANYYQDVPVNAKSIEQSVFHELCHFYHSEDRKGKIKIKITLHGHDKEFFIAERERYGDQVAL